MAVNTEPIIDVYGVTVRFGGLAAVQDVSFSVLPGQIMGLIGPNGAGKTTLFNALTGFVPVVEGKITLFGRDVTTSPAHKRMRMGVARTFQLGGLIPTFTTLENVVLGLDHARRFHTRPSGFARRRGTIERAEHILDQFSLGDYRDVEVSATSSGTQRVIEVARCVASGARLVLLDEPGAGLTQEERERLRRLVRQLAEAGVSVLITDHDTEIVFGVSDAVVVMDHGRVIASGPSEDVQRSPAVAEAYLGVQAEGAVE